MTADFVSEPDPDVIAAARFTKLKLEFLLAVEKIRRETKLTKYRAQQTRQKPVRYTGVQRNCQQGPKPCCESPPVSQHISFPQEKSGCKLSTTVHSSFSTILSSAEQSATSVATHRIHESGTCTYTESNKPIDTTHAGVGSMPLDSARVNTTEVLLDWRTGGASFSGRMPAMENQGLPLTMDSKFNFGISNDVLNTICDLESRPNLTFSRKGRGDRTDTASTSCKVAKLSSGVGSVHSESGELSSGSRTPGTGDGGGTSESDDMSTKGQHQDVKCRRYKRTQEALQSSGLLDVTMKTAELIKRNRQLQKDIQDFKKETVEFLKSVLRNPENKEYAKVIHGKTSTS